MTEGSEKGSNNFRGENAYNFEGVTGRRCAGVQKRKGKRATATINITKSRNIVKWKIDQNTFKWLESFLAKQNK